MWTCGHMLFVTLTVLYAVSLTLITHPPLRSTKVHLLGGGADTAFLKLLKWSRYWRMVSEGVYTVSGLCLRTGGGVSAEFPTMLCSSSFIMFQHSFKITHGQYSTWINIGQFVLSINMLKFEKITSPFFFFFLEKFMCAIFNGFLKFLNQGWVFFI